MWLLILWCVLIFTAWTCVISHNSLVTNSNLTEDLLPYMIHHPISSHSVLTCVTTINIFCDGAWPCTLCDWCLKFSNVIQFQLPLYLKQQRDSRIYITNNGKCVSRFSMHNMIKRTIPHIDDSVSNKKNLRISYLVRLFCNLISFPLVINIVAVVKFGTASISYLPVYHMFRS